MKKTQESGRSMVEMLGVLAIIGVLSIGGIVGYTMAMNRFRANEVIDMANKVASLAFAQNQTSIARAGNALTTYPTVADMGLTTGGTASGNNLPGGGSLTVTSVDEDGVTMTLTFPSEGICVAGANILSGTATCNGSTVAGHEFRQS